MKEETKSFTSFLKKFHVLIITLNTDKYEAEAFRISLKVIKFIATNFPAVNC